MNSQVGRPGFTLVELLVVTALFLTFFSMVALSARPNRSRQVREIAQELSSTLLASQTRALSCSAGSAVILNSTGLATALVDLTGIACTDVLTAQMQPTISGTVQLSASLPPPLGQGLSCNLFPENAGPEALQDAYLARFLSASDLAVSPWLSFTPVSVSPSYCTAFVSLLTSISQTPFSSVSASAALGLRFEVVCSPRPTSSAFPSRQYAAIDLRYSGLGDRYRTDAQLQAEAAAGNDVKAESLAGLSSLAICLSQSGRMDRIITERPGGSAVIRERITPHAPLYLLLATTDDIRRSTSLGAPSSRWLAISPATGRVTVSPSRIVAGTSVPEINSARQLAKQGVMEVGR